MLFKVFLLYILLMLCILIVRLNPKRIAINNLIRSIDEFNYNYESIQNVINQDMDVNEMIKAINPKMEGLDIEFLSFDFGMIKSVPFRNTKELRQCFLAAGDFILKYEELVEEKYQFQYDYTDYEVFTEALQKIRTECMRRNENTMFDIKVK